MNSGLYCADQHKDNNGSMDSHYLLFLFAFLEHFRKFLFDTILDG